MSTKYQERPGFRGATDIVIYETEIPNYKAKFAQDMMRHLAIVASVQTGEDSAGHSALTLLTPDEVAHRACDISEAAWTQFHLRKWVVEVPDPKPENTPVKAKVE